MHMDNTPSKRKAVIASDLLLKLTSELSNYCTVCNVQLPTGDILMYTTFVLDANSSGVRPSGLCLL